MLPDTEQVQNLEFGGEVEKVDDWRLKGKSCSTSQ